MQKIMTVSADEFLRRFLIHVLPRGLVRIRHFGIFANRRRATSLARCRTLLGIAVSEPQPEQSSQLRCPLCSGAMLIIERMTTPRTMDRDLTALQRHLHRLDSS
jgi:DNA-directed RNA polymerase subunit RPC12/RpoP